MHCTQLRSALWCLTPRASPYPSSAGISGLLVVPPCALPAPWGQARVVFSSVSPVSSVGGTGWTLSAGMVLSGRASLWEPAGLKFPECLGRGSQSGSLIPRLRKPGQLGEGCVEGVQESLGTLWIVPWAAPSHQEIVCNPATAGWSSLTFGEHFCFGAWSPRGPHSKPGCH